MSVVTVLAEAPAAVQNVLIIIARALAAAAPGWGGPGWFLAGLTGASSADAQAIASAGVGAILDPLHGGGSPEATDVYWSDPRLSGAACRAHLHADGRLWSAVARTCGGHWLILEGERIGGRGGRLLVTRVEPDRQHSSASWADGEPDAERAEVVVRRLVDAGFAVHPGAAVDYRRRVREWRDAVARARAVLAEYRGRHLYGALRRAGLTPDPELLAAARRSA